MTLHHAHWVTSSKKETVRAQSLIAGMRRVQPNLKYGSETISGSIYILGFELRLKIKILFLHKFEKKKNTTFQILFEKQEWTLNSLKCFTIPLNSVWKGVGLLLTWYKQSILSDSEACMISVSNKKKSCDIIYPSSISVLSNLLELLDKRTQIFLP